MKQVLYISKETKGTFVYHCDPSEIHTAVVTVLYVKKSAFHTAPPDAVIITIENKE